MKTLLACLFLGLSLPALAEVTGIASKTFQSSNGVIETCVIHRMPGVTYTEKDAREEAAFCAIDLYDGKHAMCAKTWSTSPGTIMYNIAATGLSTAQAERRCTALNKHAISGADPVAKFKNTMNASGTSGTYSQASLLYYHFSRYFQTLTTVPVAVYRTIDKEAHLQRVSRHAARTGSMGSQMRAGWRTLIAAERHPASYRPTDELFTADRKQIYGMLTRSQGERYGVEINGIRSQWGLPQNVDFTNTAPFLALRSAASLPEALASGLAQARRSSQLRRAMGSDVSEAQMIFWMTELTEITLLDHIFSQQDRIGNIDYRWYWYYIDNDTLVSQRANHLQTRRGNERARARVDVASMRPPAAIARFRPVLIQKTWLNDNDAGVRKINTNTYSPYVNFTRAANMLPMIRHYPAPLYQRLVQLHQDL